MKINLFSQDKQVSLRTFRSTKWLLTFFQLLAILLVFIFRVKDLNQQALLFGGGLLLMSFLSITLLRRLSRGEPYLLLIANMIFTVGIIMIYRLDPALGVRQLMIYMGSLLAFFVVFFILRSTFHLWEGHEIFYYILTVGLFLVTLVFGDRKSVV